MIRLSAKPKIPETLKSSEVADVMDRVRAKVAAKEEITPEDFPNKYWLADGVRLVLWEYQHKKCCYCERFRDPKGEPDIEHFRPKTKADDIKPGYWWLAYDWNNLFFSCRRCNKKKSNKFPLLKGQRVRSPNGNIAKEKPIFPHLVDENPEDFIGFYWEEGPPPLAFPVGRDRNGRGFETIKILGLDDKNLAEERGRYLSALKGLAERMHAENSFFKRNEIIKEIDEEIKQETKAENSFAGFRREFFRLNVLGNHISND